jgi:hypothetical protein
MDTAVSFAGGEEVRVHVLVVQLLRIKRPYTSIRGGHSAGGAVGWGTALQTGMSRVRFPMVSLTYSFRPHYDPGVDLGSNRNEYQEYFLGGVKAASAQG